MFNHADPRRIDEEFVSASALLALGVASDNLASRLFRRVAHGFQDAFEVRDRKSFLDDKTGGKMERAGAAHRQVVNRSTDRQTTDIPARKKKGRNDVRVRGERQARWLSIGVDFENRLILERFE